MAARGAVSTRTLLVYIPLGAPVQFTVLSKTDISIKTTACKNLNNIQPVTSLPLPSGQPLARTHTHTHTRHTKKKKHLTPKCLEVLFLFISTTP